MCKTNKSKQGLVFVLDHVHFAPLCHVSFKLYELEKSDQAEKVPKMVD